MFRSSPFDYDPYYYSGYPRRPAYVDPYYAQQQRWAEEQRARELAQRRQAAAQQRMRRAQYLPHELYYDDDEMDTDEYGASYIPANLSPWERLYLDKRRREEALENQRKKEAAALEQKRRELARQEEEYRAEEERRREELRRQHREHLQNLKGQSSPHHINIEDGPATAAYAGVKRATPHPEGPTTPSSTPTQEASNPPTRPPSPGALQARIDAASKIQSTYRTYSSLKTLQNLSRQFETLKSGFSMPQSVDFQNPNGEGSLSVPIQSLDDIDTSEDENDSVIPPKLAFTSANYHLHAYTESLNRLLLKLDGVESHGDASIRKTRREIVGNVEKEASRVERIWKNAWNVYNKASTASIQDDDTKMDVSEEPHDVAKDDANMSLSEEPQDSAKVEVTVDSSDGPHHTTIDSSEELHDTTSEEPHDTTTIDSLEEPHGAKSREEPHDTTTKDSSEEPHTTTTVDSPKKSNNANLPEEPHDTTTMDSSRSEEPHSANPPEEPHDTPSTEPISIAVH